MVDDSHSILDFIRAMGSVAGVDVDGVEKARQDIRDYHAKLNQLGARHSALTTSLESVTRLCGSMRNVEDSVASALEAIRSFTSELSLSERHDCPNTD